MDSNTGKSSFTSTPNTAEGDGYLMNLLKARDEEIADLKSTVEQLEREKEDLIDNFQMTTSMLLERIKELEEPLLGARPQTANILGRIRPNTMNKAQRVPKEPIPEEDGEEEEIKIDEDPDDEEEVKVEEKKQETSQCPNCKAEIPVRTIASHTITCFRNSSKCKICGEFLLKSKRQEHLNEWRNPKKILEAINGGNGNLLKSVLEHGVDVNYKLPDNNMSILHAAVQMGSLDSVILVVSHGGQIDPVDQNNTTPLMYAIENNNYQIAKYLVELGANLEAKDKAFRTPLMFACKTGNLDICKLLVENRADINAKNPLGDTCFRIAQRGGKYEVAMYLSEKAGTSRPASASFKGMKKL